MPSCHTSPRWDASARVQPLPHLCPTYCRAINHVAPQATSSSNASSSTVPFSTILLGKGNMCLLRKHELLHRLARVCNWAIAQGLARLGNCTERCQGGQLSWARQLHSWNARPAFAHPWLAHLILHRPGNLYKVGILENGVCKCNSHMHVGCAYERCASARALTKQGVHFELGPPVVAAAAAAADDSDLLWHTCTSLALLWQQGRCGLEPSTPAQVKSRLTHPTQYL